jgi:hypothetical protein
MDMHRTLRLLLLAAVISLRCLLACECDNPGPACAYLGADAIFLGRVAYTNDDGSGTFIQATLVRFEVEEVFKGLEPSAHEVWVDPGSFSSCYAEYNVGERYLVFASKMGGLPVDTAAVTFVSGTRANRKPLPPGIDPSNPPVIYSAPECNGTRFATYPTIGTDLAMMRAFREGKALPRVFGAVHLSAYAGWPRLTGPRLAGARIELGTDAAEFVATTDSRGQFSLDKAPAGVYAVAATLAPYVPVLPWVMVRVPEIGCGFADITLRATGEIRGIVLDEHGRPKRRIRVEAMLAGVPEEEYSFMSAETDKNGQFTITGVPEAEVVLFAGPRAPDVNLPYHRVYFPNSPSPEAAARLRLKPGDVRSGITFRLARPIQVRTVQVGVTFSDGRRAKQAWVTARVHGDFHDAATTAPDGTAALRCLDGIQYSVDAALRLGGGFPFPVARNTTLKLDCGNSVHLIRLVLDHATHR